MGALIAATYNSGMCPPKEPLKAEDFLFTRIDTRKRISEADAVITPQQHDAVEAFFRGLTCPTV